MLVLTKELITESESSAVLSGASSFRNLMYTAGKAASEIILDKISVENKKVALLCGNGNNGGDGFVIAQMLYGYGADVAVITPFGKPLTENADYYYSQLSPFIKKCDTLEGDFDIIIDAVFGIGLNRPLSEAAVSLLKTANSYNCLKVAVDIPSGIEANSGRVMGEAFKADFTITFIALKPAFLLPDGSNYCGEVVVADIGVKPIDFAYKTIEAPIFPKRKHNSHKGDYGTALLICGSYGMAGAAILAAKGALRSGLGIAKCVLDERIYFPFTSALPEAVCIPKNINERIDIKELTQKCDALLFGCGSGTSEQMQNVLNEIIKTSEIPVVLDADGINLLSHNIELLKESKAPIIITPHTGEMARLCKKSVTEIEQNRINTAKDFAVYYGCVVVLKGANTIIAEPNGNISFNTTGNPGMATGGSGDVLAGITVSLLAQGLSPEAAAKAAVYLHGAAGDKAAEKRSLHALLPSDIIDEL